MIQGIYVIGLIILLIVIYFIMPEMTINTGFDAASGSKSDSIKEGFLGKTISVPKPVEIPAVKDIKSSEGPSLPSAPFYGVSEDRPLPPIDPENEIASVLRMRRLLERLEGFFLSDYKTLEDKVEYLEPITNAKALLPRIREEVQFMDANPGMPPTLSTKKIMEGEATLSYLERAARKVTLNQIEGYTNFRNPNVVKKGLSRIEGFVASAANSETRTRATVKDLVNFNLRAWAEIQRLSASGTTDPITNARIEGIKKIRQSIQRVIEDVKYKKITKEDIPLFKEELERAFPVLADRAKPLPKILEAFSLPDELANLITPGSNASDQDIQELIAEYINNIIQGTSIKFDMKFQYTAPNEVRVEEAKAVQSMSDFEPFQSGSNMKLTFSTKEGYEVDSVNVSANDSNNPLSKHAKYNPSLDWKGRTKQICEQIRRRGLDPQDFGCLKESDEVSPNYSWRGHAKMVCSRLGSTPDPALPETCGCPAPNWSGWNSDFSLDQQTPRLK